MLRRFVSVLVACALMACFGAMLPWHAQATTAPTMAAMPAGCTHHHAPDATCHDCPICIGADLPRMATWDHDVAMPTALLRPPGLATRLASLHPATPERPPRHQA